MILLDTNVLIDFACYEFDPSEPYAASMLSRAELELGIHGAPTVALREERKHRLILLDGWIEWLSFDRAASEGYGQLAARTSLTGARLRNKDALIAGQAYGRGMALMTVNTSDFAPFAALLTILAPTRRPDSEAVADTLGGTG